MNNSYEKQLIEGMKSLKYCGEIPNPTFIVESKSSHCGDRSYVYVRVKNSFITDISYQHLGCSLNCLLFEEMIDYLLSTSFDELDLNINSFKTQIEYPSSKNHCLLLVKDTFSKLTTKI